LACHRPLRPRLQQAAPQPGCEPCSVFRRVTLRCCAQPSCGPALLVFIFDFTSFGLSCLLGGPGFSTLEVAIYTQHLVLHAVGSLAFTDPILCTLAFSILYSRMIPERW